MITSKSNPLTKSIVPHDNAVKLSDQPLDDGYRFWAICMPKGGGKTTLVYNLITNKGSPYYKLFDRIYMFSPTAENQEYMKDFVDTLKADGQFYNELNEETLEDCLNKLERFNYNFIHAREPQTKKMKEAEEALRRRGIKREDMDDSIIGKLINKRKPHSLIFFDDCLNELKKSTEKSIQSKLWTRNRHYYTNIIISTQRYLKLNPTIRNNLDTISFGKTSNLKEYETLEDDLNVDSKLLKKVYDYATKEPFSFLHITFNGGQPRFFKKFDPIIIS
jgi:hypothetical protein